MNSAEWKDSNQSGLRPQRIDANGIPLFEPFPEAGKLPQKLMDFPDLPDRISSLQSMNRQNLADRRLGDKKPRGFIDNLRRVDPRE